MKPKLILIAGPSSSGKSTLAQSLCTELGADNCRLLSLDHYYRDLRHVSPEARALRNFDEPTAWQSERLIEEIHQLTNGRPINMPQYDFGTHLRTSQTCRVEPLPYIVAEGVFALCYPDLNALALLKIFVDLDDEIALQRRLMRDIRERGRNPESIAHQFNETVRPANAKHIRPSARLAHIVLDGSRPITSNLECIVENGKLRLPRVSREIHRLPPPDQAHPE